MRTVTNTHFDRFQEVVSAIGVLARRGSTEVASSMADVIALADAGQEDAARAADARGVSNAELQIVDMGARLEIAAVAFLGERRRPDESLADYLDRLLRLCTDLSTILAAQRANGLEYRP